MIAPEGHSRAHLLHCAPEVLEPEVDRPVVDHRHRGGDRPGLEPWAQIGIENDVADPAHLAETGQKQQRRLEDIALHGGMDARRIAQTADLLADHTAEKGKSQIGAHRLRHGDPVVPARALHRLMALIEEHGDGVVVIGLELFARAVVGVVDPIGCAGEPDGVGREEVACRLDVVGVAGGIGDGRGDPAPRLPELKGRKVVQGIAGACADRAFFDVVHANRGVPGTAAQIAVERALEPVGALRRARHACLVDEGGGALDPSDLLERIGSPSGSLARHRDRNPMPSARRPIPWPTRAGGSSRRGPPRRGRGAGPAPVRASS